LEEDDKAFCDRAKEELILMAPGKAFSGPICSFVLLCGSRNGEKIHSGI
jgi:hypothetical protein